METETQSEYYVAGIISMEQVQAHAKRTYPKGTTVLIHIHTKGDPCNDLCHRSKLNKVV